MQLSACLAAEAMPGSEGIIGQFDCRHAGTGPRTIQMGPLRHRICANSSAHAAGCDMWHSRSMHVMLALSGGKSWTLYPPRTKPRFSCGSSSLAAGATSALKALLHPVVKGAPARAAAPNPMLAAGGLARVQSCTATSCEPSEVAAAERMPLVAMLAWPAHRPWEAQFCSWRLLSKCSPLISSSSLLMLRLAW